MFKARKEVESLFKCYPVCCEYLDDNWKCFVSSLQVDLIVQDYSWNSIYSSLESCLKMSSPRINVKNEEIQETLDLWNKNIDSLVLKLGKEIKPYNIP